MDNGSTTRCPSCQRESGFHTATCQRPRPDAGLSRIRAAVASLYADCLIYAHDSRSPWVGQLVEHAGKLVDTVRIMEATEAAERNGVKR